MLRRKLLYNLGPLVVLLLLTAVTAIWLLQGVLSDLNRVENQAWRLVERVNELSINVNVVEVELYELQLDKERHLDPLIDLVESIGQISEEIASHHMMDRPECKWVLQQIREQLPVFKKHVVALATVQDPALAAEHTEAAMNAAIALRQSTLPLSQMARDHAHEEQQALSSWFRWLVLGLGIVFLVVINVAVIVLLRLGTMVLHPVDKLLVATRELESEHFDYRVKLDQKDEFDELASAYNSLAEQLQSNEQRRIETLGQAAVMMNHELNNAIAIIDLQLAMISRQNTGNPSSEKPLRQIQQSLQRITGVVQSLRNVRRIVLTDYLPGTKMLDLERSVEVDLPQTQDSGAGHI